VKLRLREKDVNQYGTVVSIGSYPTLPSYELMKKGKDVDKKTKERKIGFIIE
jgi:hypothetical protein